MRRRWIGIALAVVAAVVLLELLRASVERADYEGIARDRDERARRERILDVAVVTEAGEDMLWNGARAAAARVNAAGGVRGRKLRLERVIVEPDDEAMRARYLARSPRYVAVIGHTPAHAKEAAVSYESTNTLFFATSATDPSLTRFAGARTILRLVPDDDAIARAIASVLRNSAIESVGVLYTRASDATDLERVTNALLDADLQIAFTRPYDSWGAGVPPAPAGLQARRQARGTRALPGAIILLGDVPREVIARLRATPARPVILATSATLASVCAEPRPGASARLQRGRAYAITTFCGGDPRAAHGFDAVSVLAQAIARAESPAPIDVAAVLRSGEAFDSVRPGRKLRFTPDGDVAGNEIYITTVRTLR